MSSFLLILITIAINAVVAYFLINYFQSRKAAQSNTHHVYDFQQGISSRWISFENPKGKKGKGGWENQGWKGHPYDHINPEEAKVIADIKGTGVIHRIWMTGDMFRNPEMRKLLRIDIYWDNAEKPAVSAPLSAFFGGIMGYMVPFESAGTSSPEGRSFCSIFQMPFRKRARITIANESDQLFKQLFFDVDYSLGVEHSDSMLYFHCFWNRDKPPVGMDYGILPRINGKGRLFGAFIGLKEDDAYQRNWWGEGEVKIYLDGDTNLPTLVGTGAEDYPGTGYEMRQYGNQYQGAPVADREKGEWIFYRFHIPDPIFFHKDIRMTIQQMGGANNQRVIEMMEKGVDLKPVSVNLPTSPRKFYEEDHIPDLKSIEPRNGWVNFLRSDTWESVVFFYLDTPCTNLRGLPEYENRIKTPR